MRESGVLLHLSSLWSPYGIGTMGKEAKEFVDFLQEAGQRCWQILPICPTGYGDSPYQSYTTFAGNPYFIDLEDLTRMGLIAKEDYETITWATENDKVDYGVLYEKRYPILKKAAEQFLKASSVEYKIFCEENEFWLSDYAAFMVLREPQIQMTQEEWKAVQFFFFKQWKELKTYANKRGIAIIGDLPIYVSMDSVDVWAHPELFQLDENKVPKEVSGCPPDGFSEEGQLWGNPLYNWEYMEQTGYKWWIQRIGYLCEIYDVLRIDHFRGLDSYYAIPYGSPNAKNGVWKKGPGMKLFEAVEKAIGKKRIIAEDLGFLTPSVKQLLQESGFPGMKILQFAFDSRLESDSEYLPHRFIKNCVAYAGTHDNDTLKGWFSSIAPEDKVYAKEYLCISEWEDEVLSMLCALWASVADLTIVQAQDLLGLGNEARMNEPSTVGRNWQWRANPGVFTEELAKLLKRKMKLYGRFS